MHAGEGSGWFSQNCPGNRSLINEEGVCSKELSLGLWAGHLRDLLQLRWDLGSKRPKKHQLLYRERQSQPLSAEMALPFEP